MNKEFIELDIENIKVKNTPRKDLGDLSALEHSIRKLGLLAPVVVDKDNNLIAGARRLQACRNVGIPRVPALKVHVDLKSMEALDIQSDENLCRQDLSPEDLEMHIKSKVDSAKRPGTTKTVFSRIKKWFS